MTRYDSMTVICIPQFTESAKSTLSYIWQKKEPEMFPGVFGAPEMKLSLQWKYLNENNPDDISIPLSTELRAAGHVEDFEKIVVTK